MMTPSRILALSLTLASLVAAMPAHAFDREVHEAQRMLDRLGHDPGAPDGRMGPRTRAALEAFQRAAGIAPTGRIDAATREALAAAADAPVAPDGLDALLAAELVAWEASEVDLNADGVPDVIARATHASGFCGAQNCSHVVLMSTEGGHRVVWRGSTAGLVPGESTTDGVRSLETSWYSPMNPEADSLGWVSSEIEWNPAARGYGAASFQ